VREPRPVISAKGENKILPGSQKALLSALEKSRDNVTVIAIQIT
jgi:hypothetical protein